MAKLIVGGHTKDQVPAYPHHLHIALEGNRDAKDVLQRAAVNYDVEPLVEFIRNRLVEIVDDGGALVLGCIERFEFTCAEQLEERIRPQRPSEFTPKARLS